MLCPKRAGACSGQRTSLQYRGQPHQTLVLLARSSVRQQPPCSCRGLQAVALGAEVADLTGINALGLVLPALGATVGGAAVLRFSLYSQLEVITAKMLGKYVPSGGRGARVLQLGGGTRELYYYPKDIQLVVNVGENVNKSLMEQAGMTAAVPTQARKQAVTDLRFQPDASVDAVIALGELARLGQQERQQCLRECARVLKPGLPLVFVEPLSEGGSPLRGLVGVSRGSQGLLATAQLEALKHDAAFSFVQWDVALAGQDPHAVGVAVRSEKPIGSSGNRQEDAASKARRRKEPKTAKGFSESS